LNLIDNYEHAGEKTRFHLPVVTLIGSDSASPSFRRDSYVVAFHATEPDKHLRERFHLYPFRESDKLSGMTRIFVKPDRRISFEEYVQRESRAEVKSEYHAGEVFEMSGGTIDHSRIIRNIARRLAEKFEGKPCESFESNLRVFVRALDRGFYPDAQVICGPIEYHGPDNSRTTVLNPSVVFEVLSPTTAAYDRGYERGDKLQAYFSIPSLKQYVVIECEKPLVEIFTRAESGWLRTEASGSESTAKLESIAVELKLAEVYLGVEVQARVMMEEGPGKSET